MIQRLKPFLLSMSFVSTALVNLEFRFRFLRGKSFDYVTAPDINSPGGPFCQELRHGKHSNPP